MLTSKPAFLKPYEEDRPDVDPEHTTTFVYNPNISLNFEQQKKRLPIYANREHILYLLEQYQTLVLVGETGCVKMMGPSSLFSKIFCGCLFLLLLYFGYMDTSLYFRIQHYPLRRNLGQNFSTLEMDYFLSCDISPLCDVTVKAMMLDHANHYVLGPLASLTDRLLGLHQIKYITPNMISASHVLVAIASAKCVASDSLVTRRLGVALFELRSMLDDLDGHVARARQHKRGESSDVGSVGYYVDGLCDALGVTALLIGSLIFLKNNPPRRGLYSLLPTFSIPSSEKELSDQYRTKVTSKKVMHKLGCLGTQLLLSSIAWNRYIALYQEILERTDVTPVQAINQIKMIRSTLMWTVSWTWRLFNPHAIIDVMLVAIFCDKLWEYLRAVQYMGFIVLLSLVCISEMHVSEVQGFVLRTANHTIVP